MVRVMTMTKPKALKPGSHIQVVSPSSGIPREKCERGIALLEDQGYRISFGRHTFDSHYYLAGTDADRASDLIDAFDDPDVDCVFCARGGYGSARLIPYLDIPKMASSGKMFCGFSDVTTLHLALNKAGLVTMHTPMLITLSVDREDWVIDSFLKCLAGEDPMPAEAKKATTLVEGVAEGVTTGGCMCLLTDSLATNYALNCEGKIVIIEDVEETPHRVDAMLTHLLNAGVLQKAAGIVIGEMTGTNEKCDPTIGPWPWEEIVADRLGDLSMPIMTGFPFGHMKTMLSVPMGVRARMDAGAGTLTYLEPACRASG